MQTSKLRDAADTLTDTVSDLAHTVVEITPEVTNKVGETALKLAALTPWIEEATAQRHVRRWILGIGALVAVLAILGWWSKNRRTSSTKLEEEFDSAATPASGERRLATAGH